MKKIIFFVLFISLFGALQSDNPLFEDDVDCGDFGTCKLTKQNYLGDI